ncbi:MAG: hypothetical protein AABX90_01955 [Nanoarchaeota archaeon]
MALKLEDIVSKSELRDPYGWGPMTSGLATVALTKGLGGLDNQYAYWFFDRLTDYLGLAIGALYDPITQIGGLASGLGTSLANKGKQRTTNSAVLLGTMAYNVYRYTESVGITVAHLGAQPFFFGALTYGVIPTLALYATGFVVGNMYKAVRNWFRRRKKK